MGYFGHWLVVRGAKPSALRTLGLQPAREESTPGWRYGFGNDIPDDFDKLLQRAARAGDGAALGVWIFDSDYGQVLGVGDGRRGAVAVKPELAEDEDELEHDPEAFAAWSAALPNSLTAGEVQAILDADELMPEDVVEELFDRLGLPAPYDARERPPEPSANVIVTIGDPVPDEQPAQATRENVDAGAFDGYVEPLGSMNELAYVDPLHVPWRELRHVPGLGDGFLGIWDREAPAAPVATFPVSSRGEAKLYKELERLQVPVRVEALGAGGLGGFVEPLEILSEVRVAGRDISYRDSRFVLGRGDDFIGLWDRERPSEPIERFRAGHAGEHAAKERIHALLFEHLLSAKDMPGVRLYLPPTRPELVRQAGHELVYAYTSGEPLLIVEEDDDDRWLGVLDLGDGGRFYLYAVSGSGEELSNRGRFETVERAQEVAALVEYAKGEWREVPASVPRTLMATLRWAQRERGTAPAGWYERFDWLDASLRVEGALSFARVFEGGIPTAVLVAAELGHAEEAAVYLQRPGDGPRLVYTLDRLGLLLGMLENYLGDVEIGEWRALPEEWPRDLATLGPAVLRLSGLA